MDWIEVTDFGVHGWSPQVDADDRARWYSRQLEQGQILFFTSPPFPLALSDRQFLLAQRVFDSRLHKNISYRPQEDLLRGFSNGKPTQARLHQVMRDYSRQVTQFVSRFLSPYIGQFALDFASFRPFEEEGRDLPLHKRNDLLHVDAFPSRPTRGGRILRVFTNVHDVKPRAWMVGPRFPQLAASYAVNAGVESVGGHGSSAKRWLMRALHSAGLPVVDRSPYDIFMLRFHDWLKENAAFQSSATKTRLSFPPLATWLVFTDGVPHAVLSGQSALEQTFIVPPAALVDPDSAPIHVLEKIAGKKLA